MVADFLLSGFLSSCGGRPQSLAKLEQAPLAALSLDRATRASVDAAFLTHAELPHTIRFLERVDALLDQPRDVTRTEWIA